MPGSAQLLLNRDDLGSDNDGNGSGTNEATGSGRVVDIPEKADVGVTLFLSEADSTVADDADTLAVVVEVSPDGGSTWGVAATFRTITASELAGSGIELDESVGDPTFRRAMKVYVGEADAGQDGLVQMRLAITASTTDHWAIFSDVRDPGSLRDAWLNNAISI